MIGFSIVRHIFPPLLGLVLIGVSAAQATLPARSHRVTGCVIGGKFAPYAGQVFGTGYYRPQKLPYWVGKSGGRKAEGKEILLMWRAFSSRIPNYAPSKGDARWEITGACQHDKLSKEAPAPD